MDKLLLAMMVATSALGLASLAVAQLDTVPVCTFTSAAYLEGADPKTNELVPTIRVIAGQQTSTGGSWELIDTNRGSTVPIKRVTVSNISYDLELNSLLDPSHNYFITAMGLPGCNPKSLPSIAIQIPLAPSPLLVPSARKLPAKGFALSKSTGRADSDVYFSGLLSGAKGQRASYTADIKTQLNCILSPGTSHSRQTSVLPFFDFTASTNAKQNGNSLTIGTGLRVAWANPVAPLGFLHLYTVVEPGGAVQADPSFRVVEPIFRLPIYAIPKPAHSKSNSFIAYLQPTFGIEWGGSTKMPSVSDYARAPAAMPTTGEIFRPFAGGSLYVNVNKKSKNTGNPRTVFSIQCDYINRWPVVAEPIFSQASTGKLALTGSGAQPRGYGTIKIERDFGSYFGISLGDDYGQLPPLYTKVDHRYSVALTYKAAVKAGKGAVAK